MCAHNGTHIDAPRHFIKDGKTKIGYDAEVGVGWFGWGLIFSVTLPF